MDTTLQSLQGGFALWLGEFRPRQGLLPCLEQLHAKCGVAHQLEYHSFTWACEGGEYVQQGITRAHMSNYRPKHSMVQDHATRQTLVDYGELDFKDEVSEMATRNIFT
jgi:hypothetical protein